MPRIESNFVGSSLYNPVQYPVPTYTPIQYPINTSGITNMAPPGTARPTTGGTLTGITPYAAPAPVTYPSANVGALPTGNDAIQFLPDSTGGYTPLWGDPTGNVQPSGTGGTGIWENTGYIAPTTEGTYTGPGAIDPITGDYEEPSGMPENPFGFTNYDGVNLPWYESPYGLTLRWEDVPMGMNIYELLDKYNVPYQIRDEGITTRAGYFPSGFSEAQIDTGADWYQKWMENEQLRIKKEAIEERQEFIGRYYMPNWYMDLVSWRGW
jgi:hypothetical protein